MGFYPQGTRVMGIHYISDRARVVVGQVAIFLEGQCRRVLGHKSSNRPFLIVLEIYYQPFSTRSNF
jgi:hypothetical protein